MKSVFVLAGALVGVVGLALAAAQAEVASPKASQSVQYSRPAGDIELAQGKNEPPCQQNCAKTRRMCTGDYPTPTEYRNCEAAENACKARC